MAYPARYKVKVDSEIGLTISPYLYSEFWTNSINWDDVNFITFIPIDTRCSTSPEGWPKVISAPVSRCAIYDMEGNTY